MPLVVHYWADLQSVHGLRYYGNIARTQNVNEYVLVPDLCLVITVLSLLCLCHFWATVCKTVRPMLSARCLSVCLSVTLVYCGQTVGRIKMKLGMQVGLDTRQILSDADPAPPHIKGTVPPNFRPISVAAKWLYGSRCHLVWS